jgi:PAS domain S-box-containing protein
VLGILLVAQNVFLPQARERDLHRVKLYTGMARLLVEADMKSGLSPESTLDKIRTLGLTDPEIVSLEKKPATPSPRLLFPGPSVEAWQVFHGPDGQPAGVIRLVRTDEKARWSLSLLRAVVAGTVAGGLLLIAVSWLVNIRPTRRRLQKLDDKTRTLFGLVRASDTEKRVTWDDLENSLREAGEKTSRETAELNRLLAEHAESACLGTPDGTILRTNAAYARMFGTTPEKLAGTNYLDLIPPADRTEVVDGLRKLGSRRPENTMTHRIVLPDGEVRWMRWRDRAVLDENGEVKEVMSFGTDVTAEQDLLTRNKNLLRAFDQMQSLSHTGSLTWDLTNDRMEWTEETFRLLGRDRAKTLATLDNLLESVVPADRELLRAHFRRARENGDPFEWEFRAVQPDGSTRALQIRGEVRADAKTKLLDQLTCTLHDITALRDAEASIKRELRFREAIEQSLAAGIVVSDNVGRNLLVNPAFCEMTGWSAEELIGATPPYPYWPEEEIPAINQAFRLAIEGKTPPQGFELKFRRKDRTPFDVLVKVAPLLDSNDCQHGWLGAVTDISAIQQTRRDLQSSNERLRIAQDVADFGIWNWDPVNDLLQWDRQSFSIFGYPGATDPHEVWGKIHSKEEQHRLTSELKLLIASGGINGQDRIRARWPDGTIHEILSNYVILRDENGRATRVVGINRHAACQPA